MIINEKDAVARLSSPMNLMNRLADLKSKGNSSRSNAMSLFIPSAKPAASFNPFENKKPVTLAKENIPADIPASTPTNISDEERTGAPTLDHIIDNHDTQIKLGLAHDTALNLLNSSVSLLATKLDDVKADKLPSVIASASKVVESIRKERSEASKNAKDREVHYHFYTPQQKRIADYEVIDVTA